MQAFAWFILLAVYFAGFEITVQAEDSELTNCLTPNFYLYDLSGYFIVNVSVNYHDLVYYADLTYGFGDGGQFNVSIQNSRNTTIQWSVNGGQNTSVNFPSEGLGYFPLHDLHTSSGDCQVENEVYLSIEQNSSPDEPDRVQYCFFDYYFHFITNKDSAVCGDPQFVGLRGQKFQVHGIDGAVYNIISAKHYAINSRFAFLTGPRACPIMPTTGRKSVSCWSHDGSYLSNLALVTSRGETILLSSGPADAGFAQLTVNKRALTVGDSVEFSQGRIFINSTHEATIDIGVFYIEIENIDGFVNLRRVRVHQDDRIALTKDRGVHGLLGQTWKNKRYSGKLPEIEGDPDDYVIEGDDLFSSVFPFSRMISSN